MSARDAPHAGAVHMAPAAPREQWLYWLVFVGGAEWMDPAVRHVIAPAAVVLREHRAVTRWFYLRYIEERGPHLRLRARVQPQAIDAVQRAVDAILLDGLMRLGEQGAGRRALLLDGAAPGSAGASHRGVHRALYEPEHAKFGGARGVALAEEVFEASSDMALEAVRALQPPRLRAQLVVTLMRELDEILPSRARPGFWSRYADVWSGAAKPGRHGLRERLAPAAARLRRDLGGDGAVAGRDAALDVAAKGYRTVLASTLAAVTAAGIDDPRHLASQYMHLTDNRLGFAPIEEALIALTLATEQSDG
jgi:hypothetical protein